MESRLDTLGCSTVVVVVGAFSSSSTAIRWYHRSVMSNQIFPQYYQVLNIVFFVTFLSSVLGRYTTCSAVPHPKYFNQIPGERKHSNEPRPSGKPAQAPAIVSWQAESREQQATQEGLKHRRFPLSYDDGGLSSYPLTLLMFGYFAPIILHIELRAVLVFLLRPCGIRRVYISHPPQAATGRSGHTSFAAMQPCLGRQEGYYQTRLSFCIERVTFKGLHVHHRCGDEGASIGSSGSFCDLVGCYRSLRYSPPLSRFRGRSQRLPVRTSSGVEFVQ